MKIALSCACLVLVLYTCVPTLVMLHFNILLAPSEEEEEYLSTLHPTSQFLEQDVQHHYFCFPFTIEETLLQASRLNWKRITLERMIVVKGEGKKFSPRPSPFPPRFRRWVSCQAVFFFNGLFVFFVCVVYREAGCLSSATSIRLR
ncbi:hypothetical protein L873DRAFT_609726 [Choiromyces venosus 120613-1]|uniref:Uncharacterized protein n=1 Tax=Choiromyces venosus 120613-1 TaxID=1336337 RepID=A0A3N4JU14_9PEZI|nr:hypothetical protein L873DRAFT_609726 [Choiromyces venosus 120613-1]